MKRFLLGAAVALCILYGTIGLSLLAFYSCWQMGQKMYLGDCSTSTRPGDDD